MNKLLKNKQNFSIRLNKHNATLLTCVLAFVCRYMYYGKVEEVNIEDYLDKKDFADNFYQLRIFLLYLNSKCKSNFIDYKEYKIIKK